MLPLGFVLPVATTMDVLSRNDWIVSLFTTMAEPFVIPSATFKHQIGQHGFKMVACVDRQSATCKEMYACVLLP